jgi:single-strand DNA-binding protein
MSHSNINRVVLVGRITHEPELRELPSGQGVCNLRIACNGLKREPEGEYSERPNYFDVATFGGLAETVARYMRKGSLIAVDGRLEWREWENAEQQRRQSVRVVAENLQFLDKPSAAGDGEPGDGSGSGEEELVGAGAGEIDLVF